MSQEDKRIIEVNGVKMEVDMREAKKVDNFKIGDPIKVLVKKYDDYENHYGIIVGFTEFQQKPAIDILYVEKSFSDIDLKFETITEDNDQIEIAHAKEYDKKFEKTEVFNRINNEIKELEEEVKTWEAKKRAFKENF